MLGRFVVVTDVAHELSLEIGHPGEDATCDAIAFDLAEPHLDLVKPRRIGWGEGQTNAGVLRQERLGALGFVRREVVRDDVNLFAGGLPGHEVGQGSDILGRGFTGSDLTRTFKGRS